jgi:hypothetical protein
MLRAGRPEIVPASKRAGRASGALGCCATAAEENSTTHALHQHDLRIIFVFGLMFSPSS